MTIPCDPVGAAARGTRLASCFAPRGRVVAALSVHEIGFLVRAMVKCLAFADAPSEEGGDAAAADAVAVAVDPAATRGAGEDDDDGGFDREGAGRSERSESEGRARRSSLTADAEGAFVRRASPRARDIARRSSLESALDGSRGGADGPADPFAATAEALRRAEQ